MAHVYLNFCAHRNIMSLRERTYYVHGLNGTTGATSSNYRATRLALLRRRNTGQRDYLISA